MENAGRNRDRILELARAQGFARAGLAAVPPDGTAPRAASLDAWLARGLQGPLDYLLQNAATRAHPRERFPWAKSVLCLAAHYDGAAKGVAGKDLSAHVARYARGRDYHAVFEKRLKALARALVDAGLAGQAHWYVDTGPVLERAWAEAAGLGWIGKNTCLIHPQHGSYMLLAELLLDVDAPAAAAHADHCGTCTRCLEACPTNAFAAPGVLDASRCIVTWNLEQKGDVPEARWAEHHGWAAGCDLCQSVCPYNTPDRLPAPDAELAAPLPWETLTLAEAITLSREAYDKTFRGSALRRTGWKGLRLGAITAAGNTRAESTRASLLACLDDADQAVRVRAAWALKELERKD